MKHPILSRIAVAAFAAVGSLSGSAEGQEQPAEGQGEPEVIRIDPATRFEINGTGEVSEKLFGINAGAGADVHTGVVEYLDRANIGSVRHMLWVHQLEPREDPARPGFVDPAWWGEIDLRTRYASLFRDYAALDAGGESTYLYLKQAFAFQPKDTDPDFNYALPVREAWAGAADFNAQFVKRMNEAADDGPLFESVELWNEPDNPWWNRKRTDEAEERAYAQRYIDFFLQSREVFRDVVPEMEVGGLALCGYRWSHWQRWIRPFIEQTAGEADFVAQHWYEANAGYPWGALKDDRLEAYVGQVDYLSQTLHGRPLSTLLTEANTMRVPLYKGRPEAQMRYGGAMFWARMFRVGLDHPDQVRGVSHHMPLQGKSQSWSFRMFNLIPVEGQVEGQEEQFTYDPYPEYFVYYAARHLRGPRVLLEAAPGGAVYTAATVGDGHLNVWLFNDSNAVRPVALAGLPGEPSEAERLIYDANQPLGFQYGPLKTAREGGNVAFDLGPFGVAQVRAPLLADTAPPAQVVRQLAVPAAPICVDLAKRTAPLPLTLDLSALPGEGKLDGTLLVATALDGRTEATVKMDFELAGGQEQTMTMPKETRITRLPVSGLSRDKQSILLRLAGLEDVEDAQLLWVAFESRHTDTAGPATRPN